MGSYYAGIMNATDANKLEHFKSQVWFGLPRAEFI